MPPQEESREKLRKELREELLEEVLQGLTPDKILKQIGLEKIEDRIRSLFYLYNSFRNRFPETYLEPQLVRLCVQSYFCDIYRVRSFNDSQLANEHRKAAFTMKWIAKIRPIQIERGCIASPKHLWVNEMFAVIAGLEHLGDVKTGDISGSFLKRLLYSLLYRPIYGETLTNTMIMLDAWVKRQNLKTP